MSTPLVSVLLPCYNAAATLDEALDSLLAQTMPDLEIVAVDDGSADGTLALLRRRAEADRRLVVVARPHGGIVAALQAGLRRCRAPYIARMDADDRSHPARLERQLALIECDAALAAVSCLVAGWPREQLGAGFVLYLEWLNGLRQDEEIRREIFVESPLVHPSVLLRRSWLDRVGGYQDRGWAEDYDLWLRLYLADGRFAKVAEVLLDWREHPARLTRTDGRYAPGQFMRARAHYLASGPLAGRDAVLLRGAGEAGRRLARELRALDLPLRAFFDVDPRKLGRERQGLPILPAGELPAHWARYQRPALIVAVGSRGARPIIRPELEALGLAEGRDWWFAS